MHMSLVSFQYISNKDYPDANPEERMDLESAYNITSFSLALKGTYIWKVSDCHRNGLYCTRVAGSLSEFT